jgi:hypothetical protein
VSSDWWHDDVALLARMAEAWHAGQEVPPEFVAAGTAVWVPPDLDGELAELVYDSLREPVAVRTDTAALRALTFASASQTIELEVGDGVLRGQLVPPTRGEIEVEQAGGATASTTSDGLGYFTVASVPAGPFRLRCRAGSGSDVLTSWITI